MLPRHDTGAQAHGEKHGPNLGHVPLVLLNAKEHHHDAAHQHEEDGGVGASEGDLFEAAFRILLDFDPVTPGVQGNERDTEHRQHDPRNRSETPTRQGWQTGDRLRDTDREGIDHGAGKPHARTDQGDRHAHERRIAQRAHQRHKQNHEGNDLLAHAEHGAADREHEHGRRNHQNPPTPQRMHGPPNRRIEGARILDDLERTADHEDERHDRRCRFHAPQRRREHRKHQPRPRGPHCLRRVCKCPVDHPPRRIARVLPRRNPNPCYRDQREQAEDDREYMRHARYPSRRSF